MRRMTLAALILLFMLICVLGTAQANYITYEYTGNEYEPDLYINKLTDPMYGTSITAIVTFDVATDFTGTINGLTTSGADQLISWSITSGTFTITPTSPSLSASPKGLKLLWNFINGEIVFWDFVANIALPTHGWTALWTTSSTSEVDDGIITNMIDSKSNRNLPGTWSQVPEPYTILLLGLGLWGLVGVNRNS